MTTRALPTGIAFVLWFMATCAALAGGPEDRVLWRFEIPSNTSGQFIGVGADGRVYTTNFIPGDLYALSPDGRLLWTAAGAGGGNPITFAADGTIYTGEVSVFAVNPDGTVRWEFVPPDTGYTLRLQAGPNVGPDGNIYAAEGTINGLGLGFFSLDANGNLRWSNQGDPNVSGLTDGDDVVFGDGRLFGGIHFLRSGPWLTSYCFDLEGSQLWFKGFLPRFFDPTSPPRMLLDGRVLYRAGAGSLAAVNPDGFADWIVPHPDGAQKLVTPFVGTDGAIYTGDAFGVQLWSANPDGTTRWVLGGDIYDSLASLGVSPDNRVLVVGGSNYYGGGWIRGHDGGNGELLWQIDLPLEQGMTQLTRTVRPAFSANGDTAYVTTWFSGDGVGHSYLYAIALGQQLQISPESFDVTHGVLSRGRLRDLLDSDDAYVHVDARRPTEIAAASVEIEATGIAPTSTPSFLGFTAEAASTGSPAWQQIQMFNYVKGRWEVVDEREAPMADARTDVAIAVDAARFVDPGTLEVRTRVGYLDFGVTFPAWGGRFDEVFWTVFVE
jgi:hypothetical protein